MIDEANRIIYVDNSTLNAFLCKERARLGNVLGYKIRTRSAPLDFGHAFHAAWEAFYDAKAGGYHDRDTHEWRTFQDEDAISPTMRAKAAFLRDLGINGASLPVSLESTERRSIERGLALVDAYIYRWKDEPYDNLLDQNGAPFTEVGFRYYITAYGGYELWYCGVIDRLMRDMRTLRPVMFEGKTGTTNPDVYAAGAKPNNQITGYFPAALTLFPDIRECIWDYVFISTRKADLNKALTEESRFWAWGVDIAHDFKRSSTSRTSRDVTRFKIDLEERALDYAKYLLAADKATWPMETAMCNQYFKPCVFKDRCSMNLTSDQERSYLEMTHHVERWEPWRKIVERNPVVKTSIETLF